MDFIQHKAFWQVARKVQAVFVNLVENRFLIKIFRGKTENDFPRSDSNFDLSKRTMWGTF
jgi:hypothetical protein